MSGRAAVYFFGPSSITKSHRVRAYLEQSFDPLYLGADGSHDVAFKCEFLCEFLAHRNIFACAEQELSDKVCIYVCSIVCAGMCWTRLLRTYVFWLLCKVVLTNAILHFANVPQAYTYDHKARTRTHTEREPLKNTKDLLVGSSCR